jgi:hypothetical protein
MVGPRPPRLTEAPAMVGPRLPRLTEAPAMVGRRPPRCDYSDSLVSSAYSSGVSRPESSASGSSLMRISQPAP